MTTLDAVRLPARAAAHPRPWSSRRWCDYFRQQRRNLLDIPWQRGAELTTAERDLVAASLPVFQQGEAQEGGHFYRCARDHAAATGDHDYAEAHRLFMDEEKRHGRDLARFLSLAGIPVLTEPSWLARAFCWCGSRGRLEPTLLVILMSEIVAEVYYTALHHATGSTVLRRLCAQILRDEKQHVRFQSERLAILRRGRGPLLLALSAGLDVLLLFGAGVACWCGHRRLLRAGGFGLVRFFREAWHRFRISCSAKTPRPCPPDQGGQTDAD
jgi:hypothetical protein